MGIAIEVGGEKAIAFPFDYLVAFAGSRFQSRSILNGDSAPAANNHVCSLQFSGGFRNAFAAYSQHAGNPFLSRGQLIRRKPIEV